MQCLVQALERRNRENKKEKRKNLDGEQKTLAAPLTAVRPELSAVHPELSAGDLICKIEENSIPLTLSTSKRKGLCEILCDKN